MDSLLSMKQRIENVHLFELDITSLIDHYPFKKKTILYRSPRLF